MTVEENVPRRPTKKKLPPQDYKVGYRKPPAHTRFSKGKSGNPGGRPRGLTAGRATALALKEAYRLVSVKEGDKVITLPAIQALRSQVALATKGNGLAQRTVIEAIQAIEREIEAHVAAKERALANTPAMSNLEPARRIAFVLERGKRELENQKRKALESK